jgi:IS5 family transposase
MKKYKTFSGQRSFFGDQTKLDKLQMLGDRLIKLKHEVNWDIFRPLLEKHLYKVNDQGGRPPYDYVIMIKILVLQRYYNMSDGETEYQLNDRLSFQRFLDINIDDDIPDESTISHFKEQLAEYNLMKPLFKIFLNEIKKKGIIGKKGRIIDASFVDVSRQRNTKEENDIIKSGAVPAAWDNPHKKAQKDTDARWTKKNKETHYGYKNHVKADAESKIILGYETTAANVHDSQMLPALLEKDDKGKKMYGDSAYKSEKTDKLLKKKKIINCIHERSYRDTPLSAQQIKNNRKKSSTRVRIEHIFGFVDNSMNGSFIRSIGKEMAIVHIGLINMTYNIFRVLQIA